MYMGVWLDTQSSSLSCKEPMQVCMGLWLDTQFSSMKVCMHLWLNIPDLPAGL